MGASGERNGPSRGPLSRSRPAHLPRPFPRALKEKQSARRRRVLKKWSAAARLSHRRPFASSGGFRSEFGIRSKPYGRVVPPKKEKRTVRVFGRVSHSLAVGAAWMKRHARPGWPFLGVLAGRQYSLAMLSSFPLSKETHHKRARRKPSHKSKLCWRKPTEFWRRDGDVALPNRPVRWESRNSRATGFSGHETRQDRPQSDQCALGRLYCAFQSRLAPIDPGQLHTRVRSGPCRENRRACP